MAPNFISTFFILNLALLNFIPPIAATCPTLTSCTTTLGSLNIQFGSQSSSQCCTLLGGLTASDAASCLCATIKAAALGAVGTPPVLGGVPILGGVIGGISLLGGVFGAVGGLVSGIPVVGTIVGPILGGGSASAGASAGSLNLPQQISAIFNGCGLTSPGGLTCA